MKELDQGDRNETGKRRTAGDERGRDKHVNKTQQDGDRDVKQRKQIQIKERANQCSDWHGQGGLEQYRKFTLQGFD